MHPLRVLLIVSLAIAAAVAAAFGFALDRLGIARAEVIIIGIAVFGAFMIPWAGVSLWAVRRASDLDRLIDRTRAVAASDEAAPITDREYHGELDDLGRAIEELRISMVREKAWSAERLATMHKIA